MWIPCRFWKLLKIVTSWVNNTHGLSCTTSVQWRSVNLLACLIFNLKMTQRMKKLVGGSYNCGLVGLPFPWLKKRWQLPFLQRRQTKYWQRQTPVLSRWRYQHTTPSMRILWNTWIFPFHMVKWGLERCRHMFSSFWRTFALSTVIDVLFV